MTLPFYAFSPRAFTHAAAISSELVRSRLNVSQTLSAVRLMLWTSCLWFAVPPSPQPTLPKTALKSDNGPHDWLATLYAAQYYATLSVSVCVWSHWLVSEHCCVCSSELKRLEMTFTSDSSWSHFFLISIFQIPFHCLFTVAHQGRDAIQKKPVYLCLSV